MVVIVVRRPKTGLRLGAARRVRLTDPILIRSARTFQSLSFPFQSLQLLLVVVFEFAFFDLLLRSFLYLAIGDFTIVVVLELDRKSVV